MKILVDATPLLLRSAGVKTQNWHWIHALQAAAAGVHQVSLFPFLRGTGPLRHTGSVLSPAATAPRLGLLAAANLPGSPLMNLLSGHADVFHASNMVRNPPTNAVLTATLHDLTSLLMPELHTPGNRRADGAFVERLLPKASRVMTVSESTRADAIRLLRLAPERVEAIHPGIDPRFFDAGASSAPKPYVLFLGTVEPRKNVAGLLDAWMLLPDELRHVHDLVIAGPEGWNSAAVIARARSLPGVRVTGYVREQDLPGLTAGAAAFVYPSLYEGFGFPVAQAMAAGVPVVTSNVSSLPEVTGDAALLVDPRSPAEIRGAIARVLQSADLRAHLAARGRARAAEFRWDACGEKSVRFFEKALG